ncbi:AfsA domain protein [Geotalea daltonii FRC-32]|uniref:AfsA domain protein n=1 Tax=Geotalea daltonii (strain DSM 22248 / JCM 15807 / FRC-32) TaxID=316067 RepID=B9LZS1_GEODF|nr:AfsA-related hotdog domain-containing protein [Geotalea daltonii]ACM18885.1 AfsA domain protein [Geotalea daltonii FRC-32]
MAVNKAELQKEFADDFIRKIDRRFVHKAKDENVVISDICRREDLGPDIYQCFLTYDDQLPFFFEHYLDHVPGLLVIEAARQMGTATVHKFYDVDFDTIFILDVVNCSFTNFLECQEPVVIQIAIIAPNGPDRVRKAFSSVVTIFQHSESKGTIEFNCTCIPKKLFARMRRTAAACTGGGQ